MHSAPLRLLCFLALPLPLPAAEIYRTDFSGFPAGADQLAGQEGWMASHTGQGLHGIDEAVYAGRGQSAYLGGTPPGDGADHIVVHHRFHDSIPEGTSVQSLQFELLFGIAESFVGGNDIFTFAFYSPSGEPLARLDFDTSEFDYGIWVDDTTQALFTGETFLTDYLHALTVRIEPQENRWTADLDGIPIFQSIPFAAAPGAPAVGAIAAEWQIADPADPGDNWLLFDDWSVSATLENLAPPETAITEIEKHPDGAVEIRWPAIAGADYRVETSRDGIDWTVAEAPVTIAQAAAQAAFRDLHPAGRVRLYRVQEVMGAVQP